MALAQLSDLEDRLEFDLEEAEQRVAQAALDDLSAEAIDLGRQWTMADVPGGVRKAVLAAATRYMRNLEGVIQSRAGDETLVYPEAIADEMGSPHFSKREVELIVSFAIGPGGFGTIPIVAWSEGPTPVSGMVRPADGSGDPIPFFAENGR